MLDAIKLIGLTAPKQAGKDLTFNLIQKLLPGTERLGLADKLKDCCANVWSIPREVFDIQELKEVPFMWDHRLTSHKISLVLEYYAIKFNIDLSMSAAEVAHVKNKLLDIKLSTPRKMLQIVGTDLLRYLKPNIHLEVADIFRKPSKLYVITDCRFANEIAWVQSNFGKCIYIERPEAEAAMMESSHISEKGIADLRFRCDYVLQNRGTIEELEVNLASVIDVMNSEMRGLK